LISVQQHNEKSKTQLQEVIGFFLPSGTLDYFTIKIIEVEEGMQMREVDISSEDV